MKFSAKSDLWQSSNLIESHGYSSQSQRCAQIAYGAVVGRVMLTQHFALLSCFTSEGVDRKTAG